MHLFSNHYVGQSPQQPPTNTHPQQVQHAPPQQQYPPRAVAPQQYAQQPPAQPQYSQPTTPQQYPQQQYPPEYIPQQQPHYQHSPQYEPPYTQYQSHIQYPQQQYQPPHPQYQQPPPQYPYPPDTPYQPTQYTQYQQYTQPEQYDENGIPWQAENDQRPNQRNMQTKTSPYFRTRPDPARTLGELPRTSRQKPYVTIEDAGEEDPVIQHLRTTSAIRTFVVRPNQPPQEIRVEPERERQIEQEPERPSEIPKHPRYPESRKSTASDSDYHPYYVRIVCFLFLLAVLELLKRFMR